MSNTLTLADKVLVPDVTIRLIDAEGVMSNQCVGGMANYGGTVKSNRAAYIRKLKSQMARGIISSKFVKFKIELNERRDVDGTWTTFRYEETFTL